MANRHIITYVLISFVLLNCTSDLIGIESTPVPTRGTPPQILSTGSPTPHAVHTKPPPGPEQLGYQFPDKIDSTSRYLFYLHGKIIEDQGIPAISPEYGEYEYKAILDALGRYGFLVISEIRSQNTDSLEYARKIAAQITTLLDAGVPAKNITVVGASKGAGIANFNSHILENEEINFVILAICHPNNVKYFIQEKVFLFGNILSIYDSTDELAGSCRELFLFSEGRGISAYDEFLLNIGTGHGILYGPLDAWILPTVQWANNIHRMDFLPFKLPWSRLSQHIQEPNSTG